MRIVAAAAIVTLLSAAPALASEPEFNTGAELASACKAFVASDKAGDANAVKQDPCRHFIQDFFSIYIAQQRQGLDAAIAGTGSCPQPSCCFRMPEFVSYRDLGAKISAFADAHPEQANAKPYDFMTAVLTDAYPCPSPDTPR